MKRFLTCLIIALAFAFTSAAQSTTNIGQIFGGKYASDPKVSETVMSGSHGWLKKNKINHLCTFKAPASKYVNILEPLVLKDGKKAIGLHRRDSAQLRGRGNHQLGLQD